MRYHYEKPSIYRSIYGKRYTCNHPIYDSCTLYIIDDKGLAVIQQRFDKASKSTWWSEIDPWLIDDLYLNPGFKDFFDDRSMHELVAECLREQFTCLSRAKAVWKQVFKAIMHLEELTEDDEAK